MSFTRHEVVHLIKMVRKHYFLYDICHKDYKNLALKAETWEIIAKEFQRDVAEVKLKWKTIKDGYLKFRKQKEGEIPGRPICNYVWTEHLSFLDWHKVNRRARNTRRSSFIHFKPDSSPEPSSVTSISQSDERETKRQKRSVDEDNTESNMIKLIKVLSERQEEYDDVDHLFKSYSKTFKKLSVQQQAHIKVEMAKLFANAELVLASKAQQILPEVSSNEHLSHDIYDDASIKIE
ncbi:hypothetical protein ACJJTC_018606 [Scirpophaga incertulas]